MSDWNTNVIDEFRANEGKVGGYFTGKNLLLLHTRGRKTGAERVNPLAYRMAGDKYAVFGSKGGAPEHPDWIHNVEANPDVEVEVGTERFNGKAEVLWSGPERDAIYAQQAADWDSFREYEEKTERTIPVVVIERLS
jgi:deazaflavin-dependent oxidoreductase (nitroreductase family)